LFEPNFSNSRCVRLHAAHQKHKVRCNSGLRGNVSSSGLVFGFASSLAKAVKLILSGCIMKPLARFLVALLESQLEGNGTPTVELARARQFGLDSFKTRHQLPHSPPGHAARSM
jgi:hypothetical protein